MHFYFLLIQFFLHKLQFALFYLFRWFVESSLNRPKRQTNKQILERIRIRGYLIKFAIAILNNINQVENNKARKKINKLATTKF